MRYAQIEACIPYATNTHIRDKFDDGTPIDMDRVWGIFAHAGFKGFMSAEYEGKEDACNGGPEASSKRSARCARSIRASERARQTLKPGGCLRRCDEC